MDLPRASVGARPHRMAKRTDGPYGMQPQPSRQALSEMTLTCSFDPDGDVHSDPLGLGFSATPPDRVRRELCP
jgi:hypothetical protein